MLTTTKREYLRRLLNKEAEELLKRNGNPLLNIARSAAETEVKAADPLDKAVAELDLDLHFHMRERERKLFLKIREALARIDEGTYGICEECGRDISFTRLKARPVTTLCIHCKKRQEAEERRRGL
jgi:DnaK suppressor protein